jgi:hypothetical protein
MGYTLGQDIRARSAGVRHAGGVGAKFAHDPQCRLNGCHVNELEDVLGLPITRFVDQHVRSLLTWDLLVFFHRNPDSVLDAEGLASRLGRRVEELQPEVHELCRDRVLECSGGLVRYRPDPEMRETVESFVTACQERGRRLALIALVLHKINPHDE